MREAEPSLPDGITLANDLDALYRSNNASEVLNRSRYHDSCCEALLAECFPVIPTGTPEEEARTFLPKFMDLKINLINQYEGNETPVNVEIAECLDYITPVHLAARVDEIIQQESEQGNVAEVEALNVVAPILREATILWQKS